MKFLSLKSLAQSVKSVLVRFPFEILFALIGTIAASYVFNIYEHKEHSSRVLTMANLGLLLSLSTSLYIESKKITGYKKIIIKVIIALISVTFYWLLNPFERAYDTQRFLLLSFALHLLVAYVAFTTTTQLQGFWQFNKTLFLRFLTSILYGGVLYIGLATAILSTEYLFNLHWSRDIYANLFIWIVGIFGTIFFLAGIPVDINALNEDITYPKGLKIFTQYVLIPLATVYVIILLAYEVKISLAWNLPKGYVSNLIIGYSVFGILSILLVYPVREHAENKWLKIYARSFFFLLIPLIVLLFLAIFARIIPYGITPQRYLLLLLGVWLSFITLYFLLSKKQNIKVIPVSLSMLTLLTIYGPQSALSISNYSQRQALFNIFKKYNAYKNGKLQPIVNKKIATSDGINAVSKLEFLINNNNLEELQPYVSKNLALVNDSILNKNANYKDDKYFLQSEKRNWFNDYLGLTTFLKYGLERKVNNFYSFSSANKEVLNVKNYDYIIEGKELTDYSGNLHDTTIYNAYGIHFIKLLNEWNYSLKVNEETAFFDINSFAKGLIKTDKNTKPHSEFLEKTIILPDSLMSITEQTPHYKIILRISNFSFDTDQNNKPIYFTLTGKYLIKVK